MVIRFGLSNEPSTFMLLMNIVIWSYIGKFDAIYFEEILVFSKTKEDRWQHLKIVGFYIKLQIIEPNINGTSINIF